MIPVPEVIHLKKMEHNIIIINNIHRMKIHNSLSKKPFDVGGAYIKNVKHMVSRQAF